MSKWTPYAEYPKELKQNKKLYLIGREYPLSDFKEKWYDYIDEEFNR